MSGYVWGRGGAGKTRAGCGGVKGKRQSLEVILPNSNQITDVKQDKHTAAVVTEEDCVRLKKEKKK